MYSLMLFCLVLLLLDFEKAVGIIENTTDINNLSSENYSVDINDTYQMSTSVSYMDNTTDEFNITEIVNSTNATEGDNDLEITTMKSELWNDLTTPKYDSHLPCTCDLLSDSCDVNCCCDTKCSNEDRRTFTDCGIPTFQPDERYCYSEYFVFVNNTQYTAVEKSENLFCIYTDNFRDRLQYNEVPVITNSSTFETVANKYLQFKWPQGNSGSIQTELKVGTPLYSLLDDQTIGYFIVLRSFINGECISTNPAAYMKPAESSCHQVLKQLKSDCVENAWLNGNTYFTGFKLIRTPQVLKNGTAISQEDLIETIPEICVDVFGLNVACNMTDEINFPVPKYDEDEKKCLNAVSNVLYDITHNGSYGIVSVVVRITLDAIAMSESIPIKWTQKHAVNFKWPTENSTVRTLIHRSGNPGYQVGRKILAGKLITLNIGEKNIKDVRIGVQISQDDTNWLTVATAASPSNPNCVSTTKGSAAGSGRVSVEFGKNLKTGCTLKVSLRNITDICNNLRSLALDTLLGWDPPDVIGAYGNSNVENPGEWVPILRHSSKSTSRSVDGGASCTNVIQTLHIDILVANIGSFANAQAKIVGVQFLFGAPVNLKIRCIGKYCKHDSKDLVQTLPIMTTVKFIDISEPAIAVFAEPPTIHVQLPNDFFYPFTFSHSPILKSDFVMNFLLIFLLYNF